MGIKRRKDPESDYRTALTKFWEMAATDGSPRTPDQKMNKEPEWPMGQTWETGKHYEPDNPSPIKIRKNWPDPEIKGVGIVRSKDGEIKHGGDAIKRSG